MPSFFTQHRKLWRSGTFIKSTTIGIILLLAGIVCIVAARSYLRHFHTLSSPDLLLDILPSMKMENFLVWGIPLLLGFMMCAVSLYPKSIPFTLKSVALLFFIRSFFIILTPMGIRSDQVVAIPIGFFQQLAYSNDFFFSGHVSFPFLFALIFWDEKWVRYLMLSMSALFVLCVLLAHTHYSIDVFAVPFIVPTIYRLSGILFRKDQKLLNGKL